MNRTLKQITLDARSLHKAFISAMAEIDKEFDSVAQNPMYSKLAISEARQTRQNQVQQLATKQKRLLSDLRAEAHKTVRSDRSHLDYKHLNSGLVSFLTIAGDRLTENDYRLMAQDNANDPTSLSLISAAASRNGFVLDTGNTPQKQLEMLDASFDRLEKVFSDSQTSDNWNNSIIDISLDNAIATLEPTSPEDFKCYRKDIASAILSDLNSQNVEDDSDAFEIGFTGSAPNNNYANSLTAVNAVLKDYNNPTKSAKVISDIVRAVRPEKLTGDNPLDSDSVKLISDFYGRSGDMETANELREIASLMRHDNLVYGTAQGTFAQLDTEGLHERHSAMVQKAKEHSQRIEEQRQRTAAVKAEAQQNSEYGM